MRFDKFTLKVQEAIQEAQSLAGQQGHQALDVEHLFVSLLKQPEGIVSEIIKKLGADPRRIEERREKGPGEIAEGRRCGRRTDLYDAEIE